MTDIKEKDTKEATPAASESDAGLFQLSYSTVKWIMEQPVSGVTGKELTVKGHIRSVRVLANVTFIELYDGSSAQTLQMVLDHKLHKELHQRVAKDLNVAATITAQGVLQSSLKKQKQAYDFQVSELVVVGKVVEPTTFLPSIPNVPLDTWRKHADVRPHSKTIQSIFRIRSMLMRAIQAFFDSHDVHRLDPNTITRADCEGAGEMFALTAFDDYKSIPTTVDANGEKQIDWKKDFFQSSGPARLTVSSQLQLEALAHGMGACWTANPSYRAEPSKTTRHVASFTHIEWEIPFIELKDLMDFSEDLVKHCCRHVLKHGLLDVEALDKSTAPGLVAKLTGFLKSPFERISYDRAIIILTERKEEVLKLFAGKLSDIPKWGDDLGAFCERFLAEVVFKRPLFVYNFPRSLKSFYMKINKPTAQDSKSPHQPADKTTTAAATPTATATATATPTTALDRETCQGCDLLIPMMGELIGSSIREHDHETLKSEMVRRKMDFVPLQWYVDLRKNASVPTGGAGMGFDRLVQVMCTTDESNIRDTIPFYTAYQDCQF